MFFENDGVLGNKQVATLLWQKNTKKSIPCGYGSKPENTEKARLFLEEYIRRYKIKSINDAGCGDFLWMKMVDLEGIKYTGFDINYEMIKENRKLYSEVTFLEFDFVNEVLPEADLILCRDCLFHLPFESVLKTLENFKKSGSRWLISTTHPETLVNKDLSQVSYNGNGDGKFYNENYGFRELNLRIEPFNLPRPIDSISEKPAFKRALAIWNLQEILNG